MAPGNAPLVFCPGEAGQEIAHRIAEHFIWANWAAEDGGKYTDSSFGSALRAAFSAGRPIIGVCATGILIRSLASLVHDKRAEPPVICVSPTGTEVVPLLGGHHGANRLAQQITEFLGAHLAITTASDSLLGCSLDEPPPGWCIENPDDVRAVSAGILAGNATSLYGEAAWLQPLLELRHVTHRPDAVQQGQIRLVTESGSSLLYTQQTCILGVGCIRDCPPQDLNALVDRTLTTTGLSPFIIREVVSIDLKAAEAAVHDLADHLGVPARFFSPEELETYADRLTAPSERVFRETGTHGVSEAAALAAAGHGGALIVPKQKSRTATCAIARIDTSLRDADDSGGVSRGMLMIVGIGPGSFDGRTVEAQRMLGKADTIVGYKGYLQLIDSTMRGKKLVDFPLGEETARCLFALEEASQGQRVALISSGDSGIYAMASLVFELLDRQPDAGGAPSAAHRVEILCVPGVTAMQMASARAGAILGHDFCAISLSDLLTPRTTILQRIQAAAEGDFVIAFYNPASRRRHTLLREARDILLQYRKPNIPVLIARNLGRDGENVSQVPLHALDSHLVDMMTLVIIGNSQTKSVVSRDRRQGVDGSFIYTPRGYTISRQTRE
ncbi:MAG: precorrin-3B C(17)-methyltransferase [Rhodobacteraceae bacterium]|nr:precorrin-3B C(17)-methyltransferase [Paracoccaceae bacterium]